MEFPDNEDAFLDHLDVDRIISEHQSQAVAPSTLIHSLRKNDRSDRKNKEITEDKDETSSCNQEFVDYLDVDRIISEHQSQVVAPSEVVHTQKYQRQSRRP